jgi:OOP family OmpA-OmpF porin
MTRRSSVVRRLLGALAFLGAATASPAQEAAGCPGKTYRNVCLPQGDISFADEVVTFVPGKEPAVPIASEPKSTLGEPDASSGPTFLSLGCNGVLTLRFVDNALIDVKGPDLYVFEIGPAVESTALAISVDNRDWIELGPIEGSTRSLDISTFVSAAQVFQYIRLTNLSTDCGGASPGADIDAVAAIGSARRIELDAAVLFDTGRATLKPDAQRALAPLLLAVDTAGPNVRITVEGHTDDVGTERMNQRLSEARARAVSSFLSRRRSLRDGNVTVVGYGESRPRQPNDSPLNRSRNRRVEVLIAPD